MARLSDAEVDGHLPLKPLVFQVLLSLVDGDRHGWSLVREVQQRGGFVRAMLADGLIAESDAASREDADERRRYFRLTPLGQQVAAAEAHRLEAAVLEARAKRLLARIRG